MTIISIRLTAAVTLDARLYLALEDSAGAVEYMTVNDYHLPLPDYSSYDKFNFPLEPCEYKFEVEIADGYELVKDLSLIKFGICGQSGCFVGPGVLKEVKLSDIPMEIVKH